MKYSLFISLVLASGSLFAHDYTNNYEKVDVKSLSLNTTEFTQFVIEVGSGSLTIVGSDQDTIDVSADIYQRESGSKYCLTLAPSAKNAEVALLKANTCYHHNDTRIDLSITMPKSLITRINDGSGFIQIESASIQTINDGSGRIEINNNYTSLTINDGSGAIEVTNNRGDLVIEDGSGSIDIDDVSGSVSIDDGSGSITVSNAEKFTLLSDGSGSVNLENVN
ncbi:MAG: hypothetical protein HRT52_15475 [Colwellia sp.]|nr:hypothetical protein [Colwellia sp.]